jgi:hypothetical protein
MAAPYYPAQAAPLPAYAEPPQEAWAGGEPGAEGQAASGPSALLIVGGILLLVVVGLVIAEVAFGAFGILGGGEAGEGEEGAEEGAAAAAAQGEGEEQKAPEPPGREARYVRIQAGRDQILNVTEIEVYDEAGALIPAAELEPTLSPQYGDAATFGPQFLVDGQKTSKADPNAPWRLPHTASSAQAMMQLDLKRMRRVTRVVVHNRDDCCRERLAGAKLMLRDEASAVLCEATFEGQAAAYTMEVTGSACALREGA